MIAPLSDAEYAALSECGESLSGPERTFLCGDEAPFVCESSKWIDGVYIP